eukprot:Sspe_Gene.47959::Locus_24694_Transcript_4_5_Confidence_0.692_Length_491::g.47959::m.47959
MHGLSMHCFSSHSASPLPSTFVMPGWGKQREKHTLWPHKPLLLSFFKKKKCGPFVSLRLPLPFTPILNGYESLCRSYFLPSHLVPTIPTRTASGLTCCATYPGQPGTPHPSKLGEDVHHPVGHTSVSQGIPKVMMR